MSAIEVIDLPTHRDSCQRCRLFALCPVGRRLAERQATAMLIAHASTWLIEQPRWRA